jgi:hypothetical protein
MPLTCKTSPGKRTRQGEVRQRKSSASWWWKTTRSRMLLGELLTSMGYDVCAIESTQANAVTATAQCRPDTAHWPGFPCLRQWRDFGCSGANAWPVIIQKPYRKPELAQAIQRAIGAGA